MISTLLQARVFRAVREENHMSLREMAQALGCCHSTLQRIERNNYAAPSEVVKALEKLTGTPIETLRKLVAKETSGVDLNAPIKLAVELDQMELKDLEYLRSTWIADKEDLREKAATQRYKLMKRVGKTEQRQADIDELNLQIAHFDKLIELSKASGNDDQLAFCKTMMRSCYEQLSKIDSSRGMTSPREVQKSLHKIDLMLMEADFLEGKVKQIEGLINRKKADTVRSSMKKVSDPSKALTIVKPTVTETTNDSALATLAEPEETDHILVLPNQFNRQQGKSRRIPPTQAELQVMLRQMIS
ncbi:helix-turn-helix domain-containing protein [Sanyastnella coralliicola]|uniref:helix-turn-helix domain-containing protein n=1 Tax=Sanyastnella coralliicola TaxID=3069118 RepID=UPI0027B9A694|nr:helix-turn-helix transcriptional regulator [Longitalea sp. SCSIO 12813]